MSSTSVRVSLGFSALPDSDLDEFTGKVITGLTDNAAFPTPPITLAKLTTLQNTFRSALQAAAQGGVQLTAAKNAARADLETALRKVAGYVQINSDDLPTLLSSGFDAVSSSRSSSPLDAPAIVSVMNALSGQLIVALQNVANARAYEIQIAQAPGQWKHAITSTKSRNIVLDGLTPGTSYGIQARAVGGSSGYSDWSNPVSRMAI